MGSSMNYASRRERMEDPAFPYHRTPRVIFDKRRSKPSSYFSPLLSCKASRRQRRILDPEQQVGQHTLIRAKDSDLLD